MSTALVCRYLMDSEDVILYISQSKGFEDAEIGSYLYLIKDLDERFELAIMKVENIVEVNKKNKPLLYHCNGNERIEKVRTDNLWSWNDKDLIINRRYDIKKYVKKSIKSIIKGKVYDADLTFNQNVTITDERKNYLLELYEKQLDQDVNNRWLHMIDSFEYSMIHMVNLSRVYDHGLVLINKSGASSSNKKRKYEKVLRDIIEIEVINVERKAYAEFQLDQPIGLDSTHDGINLIFGMFSPIEFKINIYSFWEYIKNILTVVLIPCLVLFWDSDSKVWLYLFAGIIYIIALTQSDERQSKNILEAINKLRVDKRHKITQISLMKYTFSIILALGLLLFQLEMNNNLFNDTGMMFEYLLGDLLLGFSGWVILMLLGNIVVTIITRISGIKRLQYLYRRCGNIIKWLIKMVLLGTSYYFLKTSILHIDIGVLLQKNKLGFIDITWLVVSFVTILIFISDMVELIKKLTHDKQSN